MNFFDIANSLFLTLSTYSKQKILCRNKSEHHIKQIYKLINITIRIRRVLKFNMIPVANIFAPTDALPDPYLTATIRVPLAYRP